MVSRVREPTGAAEESISSVYVSHETIRKRSFSLCNRWAAGIAHPSLDDAYLMVPEHEWAHAVWVTPEECVGDFGAGLNRASPHPRGSPVCLSQLRADDSTYRHLRNYRTDERYREGACPAGSTGAQMARTGEFRGTWGFFGLDCARVLSPHKSTYSIANGPLTTLLFRARELRDDYDHGLRPPRTNTSGATHAIVGQGTDS